MKTISLNGLWQGLCRYPSGESFRFDGSVPGSAVQDLIECEKLPRDLFWGKNADTVPAFERCDFIYTKDFSFEGDPARTSLHFERLDTYCDIYLNGEKIHHGENGNHAHEIDSRAALRRGENHLEVRLYSPVEWVKDLPLREGAFTRDRMYTRRMQCTYGWDWVARFVTVSIGECYLRELEEDELWTDDVYIVTLDADEESATVRVDVGFLSPYRGRVLTFSILDSEGCIVASSQRYAAEAFLRTDLDVPAPRLWYPQGYGEQPLYRFLLQDGDTTVYEETFGIRTVKILQLPDAKDSLSYKKCLSIQNEKYDFNDSFSSFVLKINGVRINCLGANWVPAEPYATGNLDARQTEILELAREGGVNMLRIWGGGAFETRHFYNECSRLGILVTQDFLMACGTYPEEEDWFIEELKKEAKYAVRLLRNQPCLVWWSGDNENAIRGCDTDENYKGRRSAYEGIAPVLYREDPHRRFLPSSPFGGKKFASNTVGTTHNTQYLSTLLKYFLKDDLSDYKDELKKYRARFIAEEPQMGAASITSLRRFMTEEEIYEGRDLWLYHTKTNPALPYELFDYLLGITEKILGHFDDGRDRLFKLRYMQYEWLRVVMEQERREKGFCAGMIFWMLNDCWPAASGWALIDFYNLPKDAFYAFKRCASRVMVSLDRDETRGSITISNDGRSPETVSGRLLVLSAKDKTVHRIHEFVTTVDADSNRVLPFPRPSAEDLLVCDIENDHLFDRTTYREGALHLRPSTVRLTVDEEAHTLTLEAEDYLHAVMLSGNAVFDDNDFPLLPGERRTLAYRPLEEGAAVTAEAYTLS